MVRTRMKIDHNTSIKLGLFNWNKNLAAALQSVCPSSVHGVCIVLQFTHHYYVLIQ